MASKWVVGIDIDGVLADTVTSMAVWSRIVYGKGFDPKSVTTWDLTECTDLTSNEVEDMINSPNLYSSALPYHFGPDVIRLMAERQACTYIWFVSARPTITLGATAAWLNWHHIAEAGTLKIDVTDKENFADQHGVNVFIEDNPQTVLKLANICEFVLMPTRPWNNMIKLPRNVYPVSGWLEIGDYFFPKGWQYI